MRTGGTAFLERYLYSPFDSLYSFFMGSVKEGAGLPVCGIDEAGRGPTAGPVCAAAVILEQGFDRSILRDSKVLSPRRREEVASKLRKSSSIIGIGWTWPEEIDLINIHHASLLAMRRAFLDLVKQFNPEEMKKIHVKVDGRFLPDLCSEPNVETADKTTGQTTGNNTVEAAVETVAEAVIHGDSLIAEISAASIIAKVSRDRWMLRYSWIEPLWEFDRHKGYPTARHRELCRLYGLSPIHRRSFRVF